MVYFLNKGSDANKVEKLEKEMRILKENCPHDWQPATTLPEYNETCLKCGNQRGRIRK